MIEKLLQKDTMVKVVALIIALIIWNQVYATENPMETRVFTANLRVEVPEGRILTGQSATTARITFGGRSHSLSKIKDENIVISLDISQAQVGDTTLPITFQSPYPELDVVSIDPPTVTVSLTTRESKEVGISVTVRGAPNREFIADGPAYAEEKVTITGPKNNVERVQIVTGEIDVTGAVSSTSKMVNLVPRDVFNNEVAQIEVEPSQIEVTVPLTQKLPAKTVPVKVETTGSPKKGYKIAGTSASPETVVIRGESSVTNKITSISTRPVEVSGKDAGFKVNQSLVVPSGVTVETSSVSITIDIQQDIISKTFPGIYVTPENLPVGYGFSVDPPQIQVVYTGRSDILETVKAGDIQAFINAGDIGPNDITGSEGVFPLPVYLIEPPVGVRIDIVPQHVELKLTKR